MMTNEVDAEQVAGFKDRKTGLVVFGILKILFGGVCLLMVPLMVFAMIAAKSAGGEVAPATNASMMIPGVLFYLLLGIWFIWMGIGSIMARRWARALILVSSWLWLVCGAGGLLFMVFMMPGMYDRMGETGQIPTSVVLVMKVVMLVFMTLFYVLIPGILVLFYSRRNVKLTCEARDPVTRWTDKCPLSVLGPVLLCAMWGVFMPWTGVYGWVLPFFGRIISGATGAVVTLSAAAVCLYAARAMYKLRVSGWWCAFLLMLAWGVSSAVTFYKVSFIELYEHMNFPAEQIQMMEQTGMPPGSAMAFFMSMWFIASLMYLLYIKKFFVRESKGNSGR
ncbi:MAG: hypothetical protein KJ626_16430 [Verrucomicrobia bacterium]|nr:hypothetical protein [Verrucomicrobiota bacterium]